MSIELVMPSQQSRPLPSFLSMPNPSTASGSPLADDIHGVQTDSATTSVFVNIKIDFLGREAMVPLDLIPEFTPLVWTALRKGMRGAVWLQESMHMSRSIPSTIAIVLFCKLNVSFC